MPIFVSFSQTVVTAQKANSTEFEFRYVPTSTDDYKFIIKRTSVELIKRALKLRGNRDVGKVKNSSYIHNFSIEEMNKLDSIISKNKLDAIGLYDTKIIKWGMLRNVKIFSHSVLFAKNPENAAPFNIADYIFPKQVFWLRMI
ncbi:MAG: hypothetical protein WDM90_16470 [Ferruginibacter sp.]